MRGGMLEEAGTDTVDVEVEGGVWLPAPVCRMVPANMAPSWCGSETNAIRLR
ncbi:hypothetical protein C8K36_107154 [Rhodococcus sp. OK519]|nr:hypothetical protein C8K36_107154 [Rhodococcus sp. OK519]